MKKILCIAYFFFFGLFTHAMHNFLHAKSDCQERDYPDSAFLACNLKFTLALIVKSRIKNRHDLNNWIAHPSCMQSPLYACVSSDKYLGITKELLKAGADPNSSGAVWSGGNCLLNAVESYAVKTVKILLKKGADPNVRCLPNSILHHACTIAKECSYQYPLALIHNKNLIRIIRLLLVYGADPNAHNQEGRTPLFQLMFVGERGVPLITLLLTFGADIDIKDKEGRDSIDYAKYCKQNRSYDYYDGLDFLQSWKEGKICLKKKKLR